MKFIQDKCKLLWVGVLFMLLAGFVQAQTLTGKITEDGSDEPLIGASILVKGTTTGTVTDVNGDFSLNIDKFPATLVVSYTGYTTQELEVADASPLYVSLLQGVIIGEEIVVSASRKREKVQEAPASVSVLGARQLENSAQPTDAVRNLVNVPGVQIQQQSANRINIEMRAGSGLFGTSVFPIMDYRSLVGPGIGTFQTDNAGISTIDLARIEVVRGAGSALYGPGVTSGVIHFITKNPIDYPGTTIEVIGGELSTFGAALRHAGRSSNKKFGYKINAHYKRGNEFTLDLVEDADQIARQQRTIVQPAVTNGVVDATKPGEVLLTEADLDPDGDGNMMQDDWFNSSVNATLEFRPADDLTIFASGGYNTASSVFYNDQGEGLAQATEFWGQARLQKGGFFAQVFGVTNDGGSKENPTFLYQTGNRTPVARDQLEAQVQYNFGIPSLLNADITVGADYRLAVNDTENLVYGRNEDDDDFGIIGAYLQGKFELGKKLDLVLAGRYDQFNFLDDGAFSPRAALVFKINPKHTVRASYNNASFTPSGLQVNIDFPVATVVPGLFDIWLAGQKEQHTWPNPVIDVTAPGVPDLPFGTPGLPLSIPYALTVEAVAAGVLEAFAADPATAGLVPVAQAFFSDPANAPGGVTGAFSLYNIFTGGELSELVPTSAGRIGTLNSWEVGYKGLIADKLSVAIDIYTVERIGFTQFTAVGPTVALVGADIPNDLGNAVATDFAAYLVANAGLDAETAAAIAAPVGAGFNAAGVSADESLSPLYSIFGAVESDRVPQNDGIAHVAAGYRSFEDARRSHVGMDIGLQYYVNNELSFFGNYSWVSQNEWIPGEDNDDGLQFPVYLNSPKNKYRIGLNYAKPIGLRGNLSFQHDDEFEVLLGQFTGTADVKNLVDAGIGYRFENGLTIDLSAMNLFNNEYRAFPNMPKIGRRALAKLTYTFGTDK